MNSLVIFIIIVVFVVILVHFYALFAALPWHSAFLTMQEKWMLYQMQR